MRSSLALLVLLSACAAQAEPVQCVKGGCSNHRCFTVAPEEEPPATTCEWTQSYDCYSRLGQCEAQSDGACGFTPTAELSACLAEAARMNTPP